jgi:hypothetical protein
MERNEAIEIVRKNWPDGSYSQLREALETLIPELKESEDERMIKSIIKSITDLSPACFEIYGVKKEDIIAWLEKQSEQKLANSAKTCKVEQKFKVGDWVVYNDDICQIVKREEGCNKLVTNFGIEKELVNERNLSTARPWTIQDAKDGDVLLSPSTPEGDKECPFIFKEIDKDGIVRYRVALLQSEKFKIADGITNVMGYANEGYHIPATKEQRDLLFQKMKEAGYEWDAEKKELKKIEQNPAWSEEDEIGFGDAMWAIEQARTIAKDENDMGNLWYAERWLKSLKSRVQPQPKSEWSEEDEKMVKCCEIALEFFEKLGKNTQGFPHENYFELDRKIYPSEVNPWLKSLKERCTWKPSDEQMELLREVQQALLGKDCHNRFVNFMYDLKKLKG